VTATVFLYAATLFVGSSLLFVVQPMVGKMILPLLGGTPAVWNTCLVFFQAVLLGGYAYAHASTAWLGARRQTILHLAVLLLPLVVLPLGIDPGRLRAGEGPPVLDVLLLLSVTIGLPFFVVSATAPLLQTWFAHTGHPAARDPYFLYAASNLGSMLALLAYPIVVEPRFSLRDAGWLSQTRLWSFGYLLLAALTALCALRLWRSRAAASAPTPEASATTPSSESGAGNRERAPGVRRRLSWVALAFVPSSLLLGTTTYVTTDIAAVPLLWVLPLAIYLLSFIVVFGRWPARLQRVVAAIVVPLVLLVMFLTLSAFQQRIWMAVLYHFVLLLVVALACHGRLALDRPSPRHLTEFYLLIAVGGVLGGLFNALAAPLLFHSLLEYPLAMVLACLLVLSHRAVWPRSGGTVAWELALALGVAGLALFLYSGAITVRLDLAALARLLDPPAAWLRPRLDPFDPVLNRIIVYGPPLLATLCLRRRPLALGLALAGVLVVADFADARNNERLLQVSRDPAGYNELRHGTTLHGRQSLDPTRRREPLSYYSRPGPVGQIFTTLDRRGPGLRVAVIGLGSGTVAAYARPGDTMIFYEIDRLVREIAFNPTYFTYVTDARDRGAALRVELGDARTRLEAARRQQPGERYDLIVVDAFTSDAIPVHLLTREALRLYLDMLAPRGVLVLHLSNRYLRLEPVVARLAEDAGLGGRLVQHDDAVETEGAAESTWALLAPTPEALDGLAHEERWMAAELEVEPGVGVWTDDFHNLVSVFKW
jgi:hypothetical protein